MSPAAVVERTARLSYGRLLAWLSWQWQDIAAAEDALSEAFATALAKWPVDGIPESPEAWLMAVARRQLLMVARRRRLSDDPALTILWPDMTTPAPEVCTLPDSRLRLMFVCTHPAIDPSMHAAMMLQTVLGLDASRIASAYLVKPEAMAKRLVRAKSKIKATRIRFEEPDPSEWQARIGAVLEAIYGAFTLQWDVADGDTCLQLATEAAFLAELVAARLPNEPEALGLLSLLSFCQARRAARLSSDGRFIPLAEQNSNDWNMALIEEANRCLVQAASFGRPGPYQIEAAIQAAHVQGAIDGAVPWPDIAHLYERLLSLSSTIGAVIAHAVAAAHAANDWALGIELLKAIDQDAIVAHQPWWAALAYLSSMAGNGEEAIRAYDRTMALTADPAVRNWLWERRQACY